MNMFPIRQNSYFEVYVFFMLTKVLELKVNDQEINMFAMLGERNFVFLVSCVSHKGYEFIQQTQLSFLSKNDIKGQGPVIQGCSNRALGARKPLRYEANSQDIFLLLTTLMGGRKL